MATPDPSCSSSGAQHSTSSSAGPAPVQPSLSPAQRCHADALASVFAFKPFNQLPAIMQTCRAWNAAAGKDKPRDLTLDYPLRECLSSLCSGTSSLRRHISGLVCHPSERMHLEQLRALQSLPALSVLDAALDSSAQWKPDELRASLPPRLESLTLRLYSADTKMFAAIIEALPALAGLETLSLHCLRVDAALSLEPLLQLPRLVHLTISSRLSVEQLGVVKQIQSLTNLALNNGNWCVEDLQALCSPPHRLQQLEQINLSATAVDEPRMVEIVRLESLRILQPRMLQSSAIPLLPRLQLLHSVRLDNDALHDEATRAQMCAALRQCASICTLQLGSYTHREDSASGLQELIAEVPDLRVLQLEGIAVSSLRFLHHVPGLKELHLTQCKEVRPSHLLALGTVVPQLRVLRLHECESLQLDEWELELLTPPGSALLPNLCRLDYSNKEYLDDDYDGGYEYEHYDPYEVDGYAHGWD